MIRKIKPNIFVPGNVVAFYKEGQPNHDCVGLKLQVISSTDKTHFIATVIKSTPKFWKKAGERGVWTKAYYIQG